MTDNTSAVVPEAKVSDKEMNFRALEQRAAQDRAARMELEKQLFQERAAREEAEKRSVRPSNDEDDESEPYVDHKRLEKKLQKYSENTLKQTQTEIDRAVNKALQEERNNSWMKQNADFYEVMKNADKLAAVDPELAEQILEMPDTFARQKLVYKNIKALGLHKEAPKQPSIQEKIDANRRSPYYSPTSVGSSPYASQGDFSASGQKNGYDKMKELQARLRI